MEMITVKGLKKNFGELEVLKGIDLSVQKGDVVAVLGPSGSGKSTFLRCLIDLEEADDGSIYIEGSPLIENGKYISKKQRQKLLYKMGMVFQHFNLFPHMNVKDNLILAPLVHKQGSKQELTKKANELLKTVSLEQKLNDMPKSLSGGQKQRIAIARALMQNPDILLFDEPTSALDPELTGEVLKVIKRLAAEKMTMVIVTHEINFAREAANKVLFMDEGHVLAFGSPEEVIDNNKSERIKNFFAKLGNK